MNKEGGGGKVIPQYKQQKNDPLVSNDQKKIRQNNKYNKQKGEKLDKIVDFQFYQPKTLQQQQKKDPPNILPIATMNPYVPQQLYGYPNYPYSYLPPPIIQKYNINMAGPSGDHLKMNLIYEDILPSKQFEISYASIADRLNILQYIRNTFVRKQDGEEISIDDKGKHSLLQYVKFMELNPYHNSRFTHNPYNGLPNGLLIYKTCYPIQYDNQTRSVVCARESMSMTVKIYNITPDASTYYIVNGLEKYDEWRELEFYKYIKENILEKKQCPNFVMLYCYFINPKSLIDFSKISLLNKYEQVKMSGSAIITLSESPNYTLPNWTVKTYYQNGNIRQMVETGYHTDAVWYSILFQLMVGLLVLQKHNILIDNLSIHNVYIKDLNIVGPITNYWKYIIDGIAYYIPNYGYLVMIDSNYKNKSNNGHKIFGNFLKDTITNVNTFDMFLNIFSPSVFKSDLHAEGCILPSNFIFNLITKIHNYAISDNKKRIEDYFPIFMCRFMNNRIGTVLKDSEIRYIRENNISNVSKGQIVVHEISPDIYKFMMFMGVENNQIKLITRPEVGQNVILDETIVEYLPMGSVHNYCLYEQITQNYDQTKMNLKDSEVLEVYAI